MRLLAMLEASQLPFSPSLSAIIQPIVSVELRLIE